MVGLVVACPSALTLSCAQEENRIITANYRYLILRFHEDV